MKLLVPVDGSPFSLKAVEAACDLAAAKAPSEVILVAVALNVYDLEEEGHFVADKLKRQAESALAAAKARAQELGVSPKTLIATGPSVADEVVRVVNTEKADMVVIGSRGLGAKTASFLGGTANKVVIHSPCSVLVVKTPQ